MVTLVQMVVVEQTFDMGEPHLVIELLLPVVVVVVVVVVAAGAMPTEVMEVVAQEEMEQAAVVTALVAERKVQAERGTLEATVQIAVIKRPTDLLAKEEEEIMAVKVTVPDLVVVVDTTEEVEVSHVVQEDLEAEVPAIREEYPVEANRVAFEVVMVK